MRQIAADVFHLPLMPRDWVNVYLVGDVLIDTGIQASAKKIRGALGDRKLRAIALTHAHVDHAGSARQLAAELGVPVWAGAADRQAAETGKMVKNPLLEHAGISTLAGAIGGFAGVSIQRALGEGDDLAAGFRVLDTPGHSPGHASFWREDDRVLICGDVFFNMNIVTSVPGLREPPALFTADPALNRGSERRLAGLHPATVGFGHGPVLREQAAARLDRFIASLQS